MKKEILFFRCRILIKFWFKLSELSETDGGENDGFVYASIVMSVGQLERTGFVTSKKINIYCEQHDVFGCSFFLLSWLSKYI
jgi:hypothetical protein